MPNGGKGRSAFIRPTADCSLPLIRPVTRVCTWDRKRSRLPEIASAHRNWRGSMRYALIALLGLATLSATPGFASCPRWAAPTVVNQSNGIDVEFDLTQTGNELSGSAAYHWNGPTQVLGGHMIYSNGGNVEGTFKGS